MEPKLLVCVLMFLVQVSLAKWQHVTAVTGQTVYLRCPMTGARETSMDWQNPEGYTLFFKKISGEVIPAFNSPRHKVVKLSATEFTISISRVTFMDGGNYSCSQYSDKPTKNTVQLTILGPPKMETTRKRGTISINCTAAASHSYPQIYWKVGPDSEIPTEIHFTKRNKKFVSRITLSLPSRKKSLTVSCLLQHPQLKGHVLMDAITFRPTSMTPTHTSTAETTLFSTDVPQKTTASWFEDKKTSRGVIEVLKGSTLDSSTAFSDEHITGYNSGTPEKSTVPYVSTATNDSTGVREKETKSTNNTGLSNDSDKQKQGGKGSALLIFLVTFLILCLMVVVIFIGIKLRKAHIAWKKENEDSNPSVESSKSKSSQEESASQGQRRKGILNTAFAHYAADQQLATSVINTGAMAAPNSPIRGSTSSPPTTEHIASICYPKETEL